MTSYLHDPKNNESPRKDSLYIEFDIRPTVTDVESAKKEAEGYINKLSEILIKNGVKHRCRWHKGGFSPWLELFFDDTIFAYSDDDVSQYKQALWDALKREIEIPMSKIKPDLNVIRGTCEVVTKIGGIHWKHKTKEEIIKDVDGKLLTVEPSIMQEGKTAKKHNNYYDDKARNINVEMFEKDDTGKCYAISQKKLTPHYHQGQRYHIISAIAGYFHRGKVDGELAWQILKNSMCGSENWKKDDEDRKKQFLATFRKDRSKVSCYSLLKTTIGDDAEMVYNAIKEAFPQKHPKKVMMEEDKLEDPEDEIEIVQEREEINFTKERSYIAATTSHLEDFQTLDASFVYHSQEPHILKRFLWYLIHSIASKPTGVSPVKNLPTDNRPHILAIGTPGKGKGLLKSTLKTAAKYLSANCYEVTALSHREQLIGKMVKVKGKKQKQEVRGIMGADVVINDECQSIINEVDSQHAEAMRVKRQAMDSYGVNEISKKLIEDTFEESLSYYSPTKVIDLAHPVEFEQKFFSTGTSRRYSLIYDMNAQNEIDIDEIFMDTQNDIVEFFKNIKVHTKNITYDEESTTVVNEMAKAFLFMLLKSKDKTLIRYGLNSLYSIRLHFYKFCNILHQSKKLEKSNPEVCFFACLDTIYFQLATIESIIKYGDLELEQDCWYGIDDKKDLLALEYLLRKGAVSQEDGVTIERFRTILGELYGVGMRQSRAHVHRLKKQGFIDSKQTGSRCTSLWLLKVPKGLNIRQKRVSLPNIAKILYGLQCKNKGKNKVLQPIGNLILDEEENNEGMGCKGCKGNPYITIYTRPNFTSFFSLLYNIIRDTTKDCNPCNPQKSKKISSSSNQQKLGGNKLKNKTATDCNPQKKTKKTAKSQPRKRIKTPAKASNPHYKLFCEILLEDCREPKDIEELKKARFGGLSNNDYDSLIARALKQGDAIEPKKGFLQVLI